MNICLTKMTMEKMHEFFKGFQYDPAISETSDKKEYVYDSDTVDAYYEKHRKQGKIHFAIICNNAVIGDVYLKDYSQDRRSCAVGIHLMNDRHKGKGYGTTAMELVLQYVTENTEIDCVYAEAIITNVRSCRMLKKAGFQNIRNDCSKRYYEYHIVR